MPMPDNLTRVRAKLTELRKLRHQATHGVWKTEYVSDAVRVVIGAGRQRIILARANTPQLREQEVAANMEFCAAAAKATPGLLDLVEALLEERERLYGFFKPAPGERDLTALYHCHSSAREDLDAKRDCVEAAIERLAGD